MTDPTLPEPPSAPDQRAVHDAAARAFAAAAAEAREPGGRAKSLWRRRIEPWLVALAAVGFIAWAVFRVFVSR
ncbi:MAG: hypothetical protein IPJ65_18670 [Archangiaceae bacterium]|nr:hypothetical protein [Archangiaceae bacterium]